MGSKPVGRELDAEVAREVMGWRIFQTGNAGKVLWHESRGEWGNPPAQPTTEPHDPIRDHHWAVYVPEYTTDAADDYSVLVKVRETWDHDQLQEFARLLYDAANDREGARFPEGYDGHMDFVGCGVFYKPGDFSRAALAAARKATGGGE